MSSVKRRHHWMICNKTVYPTSFSLRGVVSGNNELRGHFLAAPIILLITPLPQSSKWNQDRNLHPPPTPPPPPPPPPCDTPSTTSPFLFCFSLCRPVVGLKRWPRCFLREEDGRSFLWGHSAAGVQSAVVFYSSLLMSVSKYNQSKKLKLKLNIYKQTFRTSSPVCRPVDILTNMEDLTAVFLNFQNFIFIVFFCLIPKKLI